MTLSSSPFPAAFLLVVALSVTGVACGGNQTFDPGPPNTLEWVLPLRTESGVLSEPVFHDGVLLTLTSEVDPDALDVVDPDVVVRRFNLRSGREMWSVRLTAAGGSTNRFARSDHTLFVARGSRVSAIALDSGDLRWSRNFDGADFAEVETANAGTAAITRDGEVYFFANSTGRVLQQWRPDGWRPRALVSGRTHVYALAAAEADSAVLYGDLGVFRASDPSDEPIWENSLMSSIDELWVSHGWLYGSIGGYGTRAARLRNGDTREFESGAGVGQTVGSIVVETERSDGLVLQMQEVRAFPLIDERRFDDDETYEPDWTSYVASSSTLTVRPVLDRRAMLVSSGNRASLIRSEDGRILWHASIESTDDDGRSCSILGTDGRTVVQMCSGFDDSVVVAAAPEPARQ